MMIKRSMKRSIVCLTVIGLFLLPVSAQNVQELKDDRLQQSLTKFAVGVMYSSRGECDKAIPLFQQALNLNRSAAIYRELAECYFYQGSMEAAIDKLEEAIRYFPEDGDNQVALGNLYYDIYRGGMPSEQIARNALIHLEKGWEMMRDKESGARAVEMAASLKDIEKAVKLYEGLSLEMRKHPQLLAYMIPVYAELERYSHMRKAIKMLVNAGVENPRFLEQVANLALTRSFYSEALALMEQRVKLDAESFTDWDRLMFVALAADDCAAVQRIYEEQYEDQPTPLALYSLASCEGSAHNYDKAADLFRRSLEAGENSWKADLLADVLQDNLKVLVAAGRESEALDLLESRMDPQIMDQRLKIDRIYLMALNHRLDEAIRLAGDLPGGESDRPAPLLEDLKSQPEFVKNYYRGMLLYSLDDNEKALPFLEKAYRLDPDHMDVVVALAFIYDRNNRLDDVIAVYEAALKTNPQDPLILNNLAYSLFIYERDLQRGLELARESVALAPENPTYRDTLGYGLLQKGALEEALEHLRYAYQKMPENGEICEHLGDVYFKRGDFVRARELWQEALENGGVDQDAVEQKIRFLDR